MNASDLGREVIGRTVEYTKPKYPGWRVIPNVTMLTHTKKKVGVRGGMYGNHDHSLKPDWEVRVV